MTLLKKAGIVILAVVALILVLFAITWLIKYFMFSRKHCDQWTEEKTWDPTGLVDTTGLQEKKVNGIYYVRVCN